MQTEFLKDQLKIVLAFNSETVEMNWEGQFDIGIPRSELMDYFEKVIGWAEGRKIFVNFKDVTMINSAAIASIISFMRMLKTAEILADFVYDKSIPWQQNSFRALETISRPLKNIKVYGA